MTDEPALRATFAQVNVVIADMRRSVEFYRLLGAEIGDMPPPWDAHHRPVTRTDPVTVELDSAASAKNWASPGKGAEPGW
jgi:hypothetical protein